MARYDFVTGLFEIEENMSPARNLADLTAAKASAEIQPNPSEDTGIAGTRTSATVFTRTAGTWVVDALIGYYLWSYKTGTPAAGEFLKIADNAAGTATIDAAYGSGALQTTGTSIILLENTDEIEAMKLLETLSAWLKTA